MPHLLPRLTLGQHLCSFYESPEEKYAAIIPFFCPALEKGLRSVYICDEDSIPEVMAAFAHRGLPLAPYLDRGQWQFFTSETTYLHDRQFEIERMMDFWAELERAARQQGYAGLCISGEMTWILRQLPGWELAIEYEAALNKVIPEMRVVVLCQYNCTKFSPDLLQAVLETHPLVMLDGKVLRNFYYIPAEDYLASSERPQQLFRQRLAHLREREAVEAELRASQQRYFDLYENAPDMYLSADRDGVILECNATQAAKLGYTKEELIGKSVYELVPPEDVVRIRELRPRLWSEGRLENEAWRLRTKHGEIIAVVANASLIYDQQGQPIATRTILRDVTEQRRLEEHLARLHTMESLGRLAVGVAHDFRNVLAAIRGYAALIQTKCPAESSAQRFSQRIEEAVQQGTDLVNQLLSFGQRDEEELIPTQLNDLVRQAVELLQRSLPAGIELVTQLDPTLPAIAGDAAQLRQVLLNLALNACDAMPAGGTLTLATTQYRYELGQEPSEPALPAQHCVVLRLTDTGEGMDEATVGKVFDPFFTTKKNRRGLGLGLAVVYGVVRRHGGSIRVTSQPGQGTTFTIFFPVLAEAAATPPAQPES